MIKLFITDLDGCISTPFAAPDWSLLSKIRRLNEQHINDRAVPPLTICSGRPHSYVEAVAQWLNITQPVAFESAGIYALEGNRTEFLPAFNEEAQQQVKELQEWLQEEIISAHPDTMLEFTKKMDAGIVHPEQAVIEEIEPTINEYVTTHYPLFEVHKTEVSVNVVLSENNKRHGILKLCELLDIKPEEAAYIGDSSGDIPGLEVVGAPYAPQNAASEVKACAEVLDEAVTEAVLIAYRRIIQQNREELSQKLSSGATG